MWPPRADYACRRDVRQRDTGSAARPPFLAGAEYDAVREATRINWEDEADWDDDQNDDIDLEDDLWRLKTHPHLAG